MLGGALLVTLAIAWLWSGLDALELVPKKQGMIVHAMVVIFVLGLVFVIQGALAQYETERGIEMTIGILSMALGVYMVNQSRRSEVSSDKQPKATQKLRS